eukprot:9283802-Karenia_brevis.AAC.1
MDAATIIAQLHAQLLRMLSQTAGVPFQGLSQAARFKPLGLSSSLRRKLNQLDDAHNVCRHITT